MHQFNTFALVEFRPSWVNSFEGRINSAMSNPLILMQIIVEVLINACKGEWQIPQYFIEK